MAEQIDIFDANLKHLGVMDRVEAHKLGKWHITFHCWLVNPKDEGYILFQLRSKEMVNFPDMLDVSAAGHLEAGEDTLDGIREVSEELGIPINMEDLYSLGYRVEVADQKNGQMNREYQAVYLLKSDIPLQSYSPQVEEVTGLLWMRIQDGLELFSNTVNEVDTNGIVYNTQTKEWECIVRKVTINDFLPRIQNYYLTSCIMAQRLVNNIFPLSIS